MDGYEARFEQLTEAIIKLTQIEERVSTVIDNNRELRALIKDNNHRIQEVEKKAERASVFERIIWIIITIAIGGFFAGKIFLGIQA